MAGGQSKKSRKHDRNRVWCQAYRNRAQREKNKAVRLKKHMARHPGDNCAKGCFDNLPLIARR